MKNINYSLFFKANLFFTMVLFTLFMIYNSNYNIYSFLLLFAACLSSAMILYILIYILTFIFAYKNNIIIYLLSLVFIAINTTVIIDFFIYRLYKFHINAMVINILTSPDAMDSIQLGLIPIIIFIIIFLIFIIFEIYILRKIFLANHIYKVRLNYKINIIIFLPLLFIVFGEKISYGLASLFNQNDILSKFKVVPLYQPLTFNKFAYKYFDIKPDVQVKNSIKLNAKLNYPINKIVLKNNPNKINIFIIASDAVRNSVLSKKVNPNIEKFKKDSIVLTNYISGGNATRFGIFSLMYGLNSTYWFNFLDANKGSVLFEVLKSLDYTIDIISSTNTSWPEFKKTVYVNIQDNIKDDFDGVPWEKDKQNAKHFIQKIDKYDVTKPIFAFLFFDSPHGYSFPKKFNKFNASDENINYLTVSKDGRDIKSIYSRYKNAVAYDDKLFGDIIQKLKEKNLYDNSIIIFTSDHGQEFYEYGNFGHNSAFSKAQTNSPFIIKLPNNLKDKLTIKDKNMLVNSIDIVPTLLNIIGVQNSSSDYSNGFDIFSDNFNRDYAFSANWNNNAIITKKYTYIFSNLPNKMFKNEIRETKTYKRLQNKKVNSKMVLDIMNENRRFLK